VSGVSLRVHAARTVTAIIDSVSARVPVIYLLRAGGRMGSREW
jgi:hypothetical protein